MRLLKFPVETGVIDANHYPNGKEQREVEVTYLNFNIKNKRILLIDEICFTGETLKALKDLLIFSGAKEVKSVVLVDQPNEHAVNLPDWSVLPYYGKGWLVGYGLDLNGLYRNIEDIYTV